MKKHIPKIESYIIVSEDNRTLDSPTDQANYLSDVKFPADNEPNVVQSVKLTGTFEPAPFISRTGIADSVKTLDNRKAPSPDEILYKTVKTLHHTQPVVLGTLFNCRMQAGRFPTPWKLGKVAMIPKPDVVKALDVLCFSASLHSSSKLQKCSFLVGFAHFLIFFLMYNSLPN